MRGSRCAAREVTRAGLGEINRWLACSADHAARPVPDGVKNRKAAAWPPMKKGSTGLPPFSNEPRGARPSHFLPPRCANLLRNFSTRPPSASTLFCVPV